MSEEVKKKKTGKIILIVVLAVLVIAAAFFVYQYVFAAEKGNTPEEIEQIIDTAEIIDGVTIGGVDVSGMTAAEARPVLEQKVEELLAQAQVQYKVNAPTEVIEAREAMAQQAAQTSAAANEEESADTEGEGEGQSFVKEGTPTTPLETQYVVTAEQMGATVDIESALEQALLYGHQGNFTERQNAINAAKENTVDFPLEIQVDEAAVKETLQEQAEQIYTPATDATVKTEKKSNEDALTTSLSIDYTEGVPGIEIDVDALVPLVVNAAKEQATEPITVEPTILEPEHGIDDVKNNMKEMATYTTEFKTSAYGRRYNIWKMGDIINGVVVEPGATFSINDIAGARTAMNGWADAPGIKNGQYVDEPGGGICQVSSTLYNAVLRADLEIVDRSHHSWPATYVPIGLDATISTGAPDFQFKNQYNYPVVIVTECDAANDRTVTVSIYGPEDEMEYHYDFVSERVSVTDPGEPEITVNESLEPGTKNVISKGRPKQVANVYRITYDKETGEQVGEKELVYTDTYRAFKAKIEVGPDEPEPTATPKPTAKPTATPKPTTEPTTEPTQTAQPSPDDSDSAGSQE